MQMSPPLLLLRLSLLVLTSMPAWGPRGAYAVDLISLDGSSWSVSNNNGSVTVGGRVPGGIYTDLRAGGVLTSDLFFGHNDELTRWVAYDNWTYERTFQVPEEVLSRRHVQLVFHGVDTAASVWVNGEHAGDADNMFVRAALPVKALVRAGANTLSVRLASPVAEARRSFEQHVRQEGYAVPPECLPAEYRGECHANHVRKMQASFAWDWGPAFPSVGLWKSVVLEAFDSAVVRSITTHFVPAADGAAAQLRLRVYLDAGTQEALQGRLTAVVNLTGSEVTTSKDVQLTPGADGECTADLTLELHEDVPLWWPNGEGQQPLFPLDVTFRGAAGDESALHTRVAFRTIELVQEAVGSEDQGLTFYFRVNGRPLFAKGSNWIPASVLPEVGTNETLVRQLLHSARDVHMNMLRVWGGGVYESDVFYEVADELGILIWQDLMFACAMYPADEAFLSSASREVRQQVLRLQHHPSVALWAGNNENEGALVDNWYGTGSNFSLYRSDYVRLYADTLRPLVLELDPSREYVTSSPSNGLETEKEGYVSHNPSSSLYGDRHYYNYLSDGWDPATYPFTRFCSEYGFQAYPSLTALRSAAASPADLSAASALMASRQHHPGGNEEMALLAARRLPLPQPWDSAEAFPAFVYMTQIYQAVATQTETEHYRRMRSTLTSTGEGLCMGALYWQLNDVWQAPTWSSIEYGGRWKALHYLAADFFSPLLASPWLDAARRLHVSALNDRPQPVLQAQLQARAGRWDTLSDAEASRTWINLTQPFRLEAASSREEAVVDLDALLARSSGCGEGRDPSECFLLVRMVALPDDLPLGPQRLVLPVAPKLARGLLRPSLQVTSVVGPLEDGSLEVSLETDRPAAFVWLEAERSQGRFSRNAFLMDEASAKVHFLPATGVEPPTADRLREELSVTSLASMVEPTADALAHGDAPSDEEAYRALLRFLMPLRYVLTLAGLIHG